MSKLNDLDNIDELYSMLRANGIDVAIRKGEINDTYRLDFKRGSSHYVRMVSLKELLHTVDPQFFVRLIFEEAVETLVG